MIGQSSIRHPFACRNDVPGGNNLVLGWENKLADTVSENKMTANEFNPPRWSRRQVLWEKSVYLSKTVRVA